MESSKRSKAPGSSSQNVQCLVDGCNADLTQCRDYHRRHKVCEFHSKSPTVTIAGLEQRFCQQCSRFHSLVEFDDVKRSCRKRLDGHNRRRRKPQPDFRNAGLLLNSQQGSRVLSFTTPQICSTVGVSSTWASMVKPENDFVMYNNPQSNWSNSSNTCPESSSSAAHGGAYRGGGLNHLQFLQQNNEPPGGSRYGGGQTNDQVLHSDSALSLLSSQSAPGVTMEVGFNPMVLHHRHHHHESLSSQSQAAAQVVHSTQFSGGVLGGNQDSHVSSSNATFQFQEMFQNGPDESSGSGSHQTLTFLWE